jgi:hypothetical protein
VASEALAHLQTRMRDIEQLLEAHSALTRFRRARRSAESSGGDIAKLSVVIDRLVTEPGAGRRTEVEALNRAAIVLLCAHLQGYLEEVYGECAQALLDTRVQDVGALVRQGTSTFGNPHADRIDSLFASIGLPDIMDGISWQRCANQTVRSRLTDYIRLRNTIAHGTLVTVHKAKVTSFKRFVEVFAERFDHHVAREVASVIGTSPW